MMQVLKTIRDFLTEEKLKWLPGNMQIRSCILLKDNITDERSVFRTVLHVFDDGGIYIGTIDSPHYIPK